MLGDSRVMAGRKLRGAGALGEVEQLVEAEAAVAADARVRRLAGRVAADERADDRAAELLAQVERDVRQPERVAGRARREHGFGRAAGALAVGPFGVEPEPERHADRVRPGLEQGDGAVDAAAHRDRDPPRVRRSAEDRPERVRERVHGQLVAADRGCLEQGQSLERPREPFGLRTDDAVPLDRQADECPAAVAGGVSDDLDHGAQATETNGGNAWFPPFLPTLPLSEPAANLD